jgi:hypothetical protein
MPHRGNQRELYKGEEEEVRNGRGRKGSHSMPHRGNQREL